MVDALYRNNDLRIIVPFPNIYLEQGAEGFPARCPACDSVRYTYTHRFVDEANSFAINPGKFGAGFPSLRYQRYTILNCHQCGFQFHIRPEGKWYEKDFGILGGGTFVASSKLQDSVNPRRERNQKHAATDEGYFIGQLPGHQNVERQIEALSDEYPIFKLPAPHVIGRVLPTGSIVPVCRRQDFRIFDLAARKRYSDYRLNPLIVNSRIALVVGAGFSCALGFPTMAQFKNSLPDWVVNKVDEWIGPKRASAIQVWDDLEVLVDVLLNMQRVALCCREESDFVRVLNEPYSTSSFTILEQSSTGQEAGDAFWVSYPPVAHVTPHPSLRANTTSAHFRTVRKLLFEVIKAITVTCHTIEKRFMDPAARYYLPFLQKLSACNKSPLPIYSTNYDRVIEQVCAHNSLHLKVEAGVALGAAPPISIRYRNPNTGKVGAIQLKATIRNVEAETFNSVTTTDIALFHLHGCANWFIHRDTRRTIEVSADTVDDLAAVLNLMWHGIDNWLPGNIAPATVKDAYTVSPPFNIGYDYFAENIKRMKVMVIIGQRLRDQTIKEMVFWSAKCNPDLNYLVVGYGDQISPHITDCVPDDRLTYLNGGFPEEADQIVEFCKRHTGP